MVCAQTLEHLGLDRLAARRIADRVAALRLANDPGTCWRRITRSVLSPNEPVEVHRCIWEAVFADWPAGNGPPPAWLPSPSTVERANLTQFMQQLGLGDYAALHRWSIENREAFWAEVVRTLGICFQQRPAKILDSSRGPAAPRWLTGARLNIVESCFQAVDDDPAIVAAAASGSLRRMTYGQLRALTNRLSNGLRAAGFGPGDPVAIVMPMTVESVAIYLGIVQAGCAVVSIADSFAAPEIRTRLRIAGAKGVFTVGHAVRAGKHLPIYKKVVAAEAPRAIVLGPIQDNAVSLRDGDLWWEDFLSGDREFNACGCSPEDCINVLFSSGTTGEPKAIPWDHTTPIRCAADGYLHHDIHAGDVVVWPTNLGWMMGPWLIFATLINRGTIGLYEDVPTGRGFGRFVEQVRVNMLGVVPTLVRAWRQSGCMEGLDWSTIRAFSSTGEPSNPDDMFYLMRLAGYRPIIEYCGGTEVGGGYITSTVIQPNVPSAFSTPGLGLDFVILDDQGQRADCGELFLIPPSIGLSSRLLNGDHHKAYFEKTPAGPEGCVLRRHGDQMQRLPGRFWRALGRADDTMNLGGIKVSSAEIESAIGKIEGVAEVAAVAVARADGGPDRLIVYAVIGSGARQTCTWWLAAMQQVMREQLNPLFKIQNIVLVDALPRTASGKVMRRQLRARYGALATGEEGRHTMP